MPKYVKLAEAVKEANKAVGIEYFTETMIRYRARTGAIKTIKDKVTNRHLYDLDDVMKILPELPGRQQQ